MFLKEKKKIEVRMFFELMGWPKDDLNKYLKKIIDHLRKRWKIKREEYAEPEKIGKKMYTTHVEFEAEVPDLRDLFAVTISFGPSVIEILNPSEIIITANELQDILADISSKVAEMDKQIKILSARFRQAQLALKKLKIEPKKEKEAKNGEIKETSKFIIKK